MVHSVKKINEEIKQSEKYAEQKGLGKFNTNDISDGYHTFGELYEHRIALFIALCNLMTEVENPNKPPVWKSKKHHDGTMFAGGWFIAGIHTREGLQISYHLPLKDWDKLTVQELEKAPVWDGHTPADVVERLLELV